MQSSCQRCLVSDFPRLDTSRSVGHVDWRGASSRTVRYRKSAPFHLKSFSFELHPKTRNLYSQHLDKDGEGRRCLFAGQDIAREEQTGTKQGLWIGVIDTIITPYSDGYRYRYAPVVDLEKYLF